MAIDSPCSDPCGPGCPIRTSADQSLLAAPHGLSQPITSFIASWRQGIHRMPFLHLIHELHHAQGKTPRAELHSISAISIPAITSFTMSYNTRLTPQPHDTHPQSRPQSQGISYLPQYIDTDPKGSRRTRLKAKTQRVWWAWEDLNFRPHAYQARALTN